MNPTFVTVARFTYSSEAKIIKGRLESDGIQTFLYDDITIDTDPFISNAIGGVKLKVAKEDEEKAKNILASISQYSVDDEGNAICCPNCDSTNIEYFSNINDIKSLLHFLFGFLFSGLPFYSKYQYQCEDCNTKFDKQ